MRWSELEERIKSHNEEDNYSYDPDLIKDIIAIYTDGNMELYELYNWLNKVEAIQKDLGYYFNSVQLNSFDKNILRYVSESNDKSRLDLKYINYSDKGYLYRNKPFILLPIVKQELADMLVASDSEKACLAYFKKHDYDLERAKEEGFSSNGDWKEDIEMFIQGWKETVKYLTYLVETTKGIISYFENGLKENPIAIRQFFYDYAYTFDFFVLVMVYETYIKYHHLDEDIANDISNHYKTLKPVDHARLDFRKPKKEEENETDDEEVTVEYTDFDDDDIFEAETIEEEPSIFADGLAFIKNMFRD